MIEHINAEDERSIQGVKDQQKISEMYAQKDEADLTTTAAQTVSLADLDESELQVEGEMDARIEAIFGRRVALCLIATNWQYKEQAMKFVLKTAEKFLTRPEVGAAMPFTLSEIVEGSLAAVGLTCREKVIKVFNLSLQLFNMTAQSSKVEKDFAATAKVVQVLKSEFIIEKLLLKSEESNTRVTNKIHEALLDLSYLEQVGDQYVSTAVIDLIIKHN